MLGAPLGFSQTEEQFSEELQESSDEHMREEFGVNPITSPSIARLLNDLEIFRPIPIRLIESTDHSAAFGNRLQTALHFGSLVTDGFMFALAERPQDIQNIGKELIRESKTLGVGGRLTTRSKSLFELSDKGDWVGMREELVRTQDDVEQSMMELHDEEMAHMISLGGWLRGFQLGATSTEERYSEAKAKILGRIELVEYFLDRLDTLNPRLKQTEMVTAFIARLREIRLVMVETQGAVPTEAQIARFKKLADQAEGVVTARVDADGKFLEKTKL